MNVLSLFDGMSCGMQALERSGIKVDNYFASEIDKYAIQVSQKNYPNIIHVGDVRNIEWYTLPKIDLLIGGSPCQSFSFAGKRAGMSTKDSQEILTLEDYLKLKEDGFEFEGQSYLFWEYMRILKELKPKYFLLENVMMSQKWRDVLTKAIGIDPIMINSSLLSAQNRKRLYWTNINAFYNDLTQEQSCGIALPKDKGVMLKDILEDEVEEKYYLSEKFVNGLLKHNENHKEKGTGFIWEPRDMDGKASTIRANAALCPTDNTIVCHNLHTRSADRPSIQKNKNAGGSGPLSRKDGKTYCLDTANTQAIEVVGCDYRRDEGFRYRDNGKSGTLAARAREDESCGQLASINLQIRKLTPVECERLQTIKDNYTEGVSNAQRYKMLGNGWTVDVISHIFNHLPKQYFMQNNEPTFDELIGNVYQWAKEKDLLKPENAPKQFMKCIEEFGETASAINKRHYDQIKDGVGDTFVTVIILCLQLGLTPQEALASAWDEIKNRKGKTINGVFVKNEDTSEN